MGGGHCRAMPGRGWSTGQQGRFAHIGHACRERDAGGRLGRLGGNECCQAGESSGDGGAECDPSRSEYGAGQLYGGRTDGCDDVRADGMGSGHICEMSNRQWRSWQWPHRSDGWSSAGHGDCEPVSGCYHGESSWHTEPGNIRIGQPETARSWFGSCIIYCFVEVRQVCV